MVRRTTSSADNLKFILGMTILDLGTAGLWNYKTFSDRKLPHPEMSIFAVFPVSIGGGRIAL